MSTARRRIAQIPTHRCPNAGDFIGDHRNPDARLAEQDASLKLTLSHRRGDLVANRRIITWRWGMGPEIRDLNPLLLEQRNELSLKRDPAMIGSNGHPLDAPIFRPWQAAQRGATPPHLSLRGPVAH
jgi:hypothetical protein